MKGATKKMRNFFEIVKAFPTGRYGELADATGLDRSTVATILRDFLRRGEIVVRSGMYHYVRRPHRGEIADRLWRAFRYCPTWTVSEVAQIADVKRDSVHTYVSMYVRLGYVQRVGTERTETGLREVVYRLRDRSLRERPCLKK